MENQIEELRDDLEAEKGARTKAEKQRRELSEVMQVPRISSNFCTSEVGGHWEVGVGVGNHISMF